MQLIRTILSIAIAASLALAPVGSLAAGMVTAQEQFSVQISPSDGMTMEDCCPDHLKTTAPSHTLGYKCPMGLCCAGLVSLGEIAGTRIEFFSGKASILSIPVDQTVSVRGGSPPFRPPRA